MTPENIAKASELLAKLEKVNESFMKKPKDGIRPPRVEVWYDGVLIAFDTTMHEYWNWLLQYRVKIIGELIDLGVDTSSLGTGIVL